MEKIKKLQDYYGKKIPILLYKKDMSKYLNHDEYDNLTEEQFYCIYTGLTILLCDNFEDKMRKVIELYRPILFKQNNVEKFK